MGRRTPAHGGAARSDPNGYGRASPCPHVDASSAAAGVSVGVLVCSQGRVALGVPELLTASDALVEVQRARARSRPGRDRTGWPATSSAALQRGMKRPVGRKLNWVARPEGRGGDAEAADLVDPIGAMPGTVGSLGVEQEPSGAAAPQRVWL